MGSRLEICCGLHAVAHRRSARRGLLRPFHDANGPAHFSVLVSQNSGQLVLHILTKVFVLYEFRWFRSSRGEVGLPLRRRCPVLELPAAGGGVATELPRYRRR